MSLQTLEFNTLPTGTTLDGNELLFMKSGEDYKRTTVSAIANLVFENGISGIKNTFFLNTSDEIVIPPNDLRFQDITSFFEESGRIGKHNNIPIGELFDQALLRDHKKLKFKQDMSDKANFINMQANLLLLKAGETLIALIAVDPTLDESMYLPIESVNNWISDNRIHPIASFVCTHANNFPINLHQINSIDYPTAMDDNGTPISIDEYRLKIIAWSNVQQVIKPNSNLQLNFTKNV